MNSRMRNCKYFRSYIYYKSVSALAFHPRNKEKNLSIVCCLKRLLPGRNHCRTTRRYISLAEFPMGTWPPSDSMLIWKPQRLVEKKHVFWMHTFDPNPRTIVHFGLWDAVHALSWKCPSTSIYCMIKLLALFTPPSPLQVSSNTRPTLILTSNAVHKFRLKSYHRYCWTG